MRLIQKFLKSLGGGVFLALTPFAAGPLLAGPVALATALEPQVPALGGETPRLDRALTPLSPPRQQVWQTNPKPRGQDLEIHLIQTRLGWRARVADRVAIGALVLGHGKDLLFTFPQGRLRLSFPTQGDQAGPPQAFWIDPPRPPLVAYEMASPVRWQKHHGRQGVEWTASLSPFDPDRRISLILETQADGSRTAFFDDFGRNFAGGRRFVFTEHEGNLVLQDQRDPSLQIQGKVGSEEIELVVAELGGRVKLYPRSEPAKATPYDYHPPKDLGDGWTVTDAGALGIRVKLLAELVNKIRSEPRGPSAHRVHSLALAYRGALVLDETFSDYEGAPHDSRSAGKSVTTTLIGAAMTQGVRLAETTRIYPLFSTKYPRIRPNSLVKDLRLGDLMSMQSGYACDDENAAMPGNEDTVMAKGGDIEARILNLPSLTPPHKGYAVYCSIDLHLAAASLAQKTGRWLPDMFDTWLARPLDFGPYSWNLTPNGEGYGAGGAYVRPRDLLKLGQVYLSGGVWRGRRVVSQAWVQKATQSLAVFAPPEPVGGQPPPASVTHSYGYGWHRYRLTAKDRYVDAYAATGNGGQLVVVIPEFEAVIGFSGGNYNQYRLWGQWLQDWIPNRILPALPPPSKGGSSVSFDP